MEERRRPPDLESPPEFEAPPDFESPPGLESSPPFEAPPSFEAPPGPGASPGFEAPPGFDTPGFEAPPSFEAPPEFESPPDGNNRPPAAEIRVLVADFAGRRCAVPVEQIVQIDAPGDVVPLPGVAPWLCGVTHLRGEIISVIDPAALLDAAAGTSGPTAGAGRRLLVVRTPDRGMSAGFLVDRVARVRVLDPGRTAAGEPCPTILTPFVDGTFEVGGETVTLIDLGGLLASPALREY